MLRGIVVLASALVLAVPSSAAAAATFTVTGFDDPVGASCSGTTCSSLRAAITAADQVANTGSTVSLAAGTYTLGGSGMAGGPLQITLDMTVSGAGQSATIIKQTGGGYGVVAITTPTANVTMADLTITGGDAVGVSQPTATPPNPGVAGGNAVGGILDAGVLTLDRVSVSGNTATGGAGGATLNGGSAPGVGGNAVAGVEVSGSLTVNGGAVRSNTAIGGTGGAADGTADAATGGSAVGGVAIDPGAGAVQIAGADLSNNVSTGGPGGTSAGSSSNHDGAGGPAFGALADLGAQPVSVTRSTFNNNAVKGGSGGAAQMAATGGAGGRATGGGIYDAGGALTVADTAIDGDVVTGGDGGSAAITSGAAGPALGGGLAVSYPGSASIERATIALDSVAAGMAGPTNSTFGVAANGADAQGGGAYLAGTSSLVNVTLANDLATGSAGGPANGSVMAGTPGRGIGGGISVQPSGVAETLTLASDTLASNAVTASGGGATFGGDLDDGDVPTTAADTIFSAGTGNPSSGTCAIFGGVFTDAGHNIEATTPSQCGLTLASDLVGTDPQLGQLAGQGGPGPTLAPAALSMARGAGGACTDPLQAGDPPLTIDERGAPRHAQCDIGAYETQPPSVASALQLSGPAAIGTPLTCPTAEFVGDAPLTYVFTWLRAGAAIAGANSATYTPSSDDAGRAVSCSVTASNAYGSAAALSNAVTVPNAPTVSNPTPSPDFTGASLRSTRLIDDRRGHIVVRLSCPASTPGGRCSVTVALYSKAGSVPASAARHRKRTLRAALLARGSAVIAAGHTKMLKLSLTRRGRRATKHLPLTVRVVMISHDSAGTVARRSIRAKVQS